MHNEGAKTQRTEILSFWRWTNEKCRLDVQHEETSRCYLPREPTREHLFQPYIGIRDPLTNKPEPNYIDLR